uniref:Longin domain-containing protein n=1 Tax=Brassica oleracea TaxID=3712 RepID=A0A3P6BUW5_BRAOL|nr:unnamed protein product [Brassica oleracea]
MSQQKGLIYSFVAKGTVVLAEQSILLTQETLAPLLFSVCKSSPKIAAKYTYSCDAHTFNFLVENNGFVFLVVADESTGRSVFLLFSLSGLRKISRSGMRRV